MPPGKDFATNRHGRANARRALQNRAAERAAGGRGGKMTRRGTRGKGRGADDRERREKREGAEVCDGGKRKGVSLLRPALPTEKTQPLPLARAVKRVPHLSKNFLPRSVRKIFGVPILGITRRGKCLGSETKTRRKRLFLSVFCPFFRLLGGFGTKRSWVQIPSPRPKRPQGCFPVVFLVADRQSTGFEGGGASVSERFA